MQNSRRNAVQEEHALEDGLLVRELVKAEFAPVTAHATGPDASEGQSVHCNKIVQN